MWDKILNLGHSISSMLTNSGVPPNTPIEYVEELKSINFLRSKKFFIVFTSVLMLVAFYGISVFILFLTAPVPGITAPFVTIFVETIKIFAFIIAAYLGLQTAIDFKYNSESNTSLKGEMVQVKEEVDESIVGLFEEKFKKDRSYAPIGWSMEQPHE
jgi:hypothetical protein